MWATEDMRNRAVLEDWRCGFNTACPLEGITADRVQFYNWLPLDVVGNTPRISEWHKWVKRFEQRNDYADERDTERCALR